MKRLLAAIISLLLSSAAFAAFDESHFNYGRQWKGELKGVNLSGKGLSHLAMYIGDGSRDIYNPYWEGEMLKAAKTYNLTPVFYAYVIAEWDKHLGYVDCDVGSPNHCTNGAQTIRTQWSTILSRYTEMAQGVANDFGTSGTTIWLIEPDFFQYSASGDARSNFNQVGGGIPDDSLCGKYFNDIVNAIKSKLPNAKIAVDISPWMNDFVTTWYAKFDASKVDYLFTSGGRTQGDQNRIRGDNGNTMTWAQASAAMGGKKIIADDGYGVGGASNNDYQDWMNVNNLNNRISDGVIGITIQDPGDAFYEFAAQHPISLGGGGGNSSSSTAQSSSSRPSSSSAAPTPSNLTALIDDFEDGDEFSEWGGEWSTYTDAGDGGQSTVTTSFSTGYNSSKALKASYALKKGNLLYDPQVGVTVDLLADKSTVNLNSCTSISYYYKGAAHSVRMESPLVTDYAYHQASAATTNSWTKKTVTLTSMTQPDWTKTIVDVNSARQNVKAFSWQVSGTTGATGSLEIDNVRCEGLPEAVSSSSSAKSSSSVSSSSARSSSSVSSSSVSSSSVSSSSVSSSSVSSSSAVSSSGSMGGPCIAFVNGSGDYGDYCYNSGLKNMAEGKCYTMNPERNPAPQYISDDVSQTYWWVETSCGIVESSSSSEESSSSAIPTYTITFKNGNTTLQTVEVEQGVVPAYTGATPTKAATAQYTYTFKSWNPAIVAASKNATYTAMFDSVVNRYAIKFLNGNSVLEADSVAYGSLPVYSGNTPTKAATAEYTFTFSGWSPQLATVTKDENYTAQFAQTTNKYTVTFVDEDTTKILKAAKQYDYGTAAANIEKPANPTKNATAEYTYTFAGWTPTIVQVKANATYKATYTATKRKYTITFKNGDNSTTTQNVEYGTVPTAPAGKTPANTAQYSYTFVGWDDEIVAVTGAATYTAVVDSALNKYTVTFVDENGTTVLKEATWYDYGTAAASIAKPANPTKPGNNGVTYTFAGWTPEISTVTKNVTYRATYNSSANTYTVIFVDDDGEVLLEAREYEYGTSAANIARPANPTKKASAEFTYTFAGWSPAISAVSGNATYTATYTATKNKYTVTFLNYDDTSLQSSKVEYGAMPEYKGAIPTRDSDAEYSYTFAGWDPEIAEVTGIATYTATFSTEAIPVVSSSSEQVVESSSSEQVEESSSSEEVVESSSSETVESSSSETTEESSTSVESSSAADGIVISGNLQQTVVKGDTFETVTISGVETWERSWGIYWLAFNLDGNVLTISNSGSTEYLYKDDWSESFTVNGTQYEISVDIVAASAVSSSSAEESSSSSESNIMSSGSEIVYSSSANYVGPSSNSNYAEASSNSNYIGPSSDSNYSGSNGDNSLAISAGAFAQLKMSFRHNVLTVAVPKPSLVRVQVFDMLGNRVKTFQDSFAGTREVSLQGLPQGSYMVRVVTGSSAKTSRINIR